MKSYSEYKDSGIEWLGEIPEGWEIVRMKYALVLQRGVDLPVTEMKRGEYPVYGSNGVIGYHDQYTTKGPGVTVGRSGSVGEVNWVDRDFWAHNTALYVKHYPRTQERFAFYLLSTIDLKSISAGSAVGTLNRNYIHNMYCALPSLSIQKQVATFLDQETTKIDALIAKKQRQIELLQEKRTALISHAVTKGLDPNSKMKDSGIEWLGEIPEGWEVKSLKHVASLRSGNSITSDDIDDSGDYPVFGANGLRGYTSLFTHEGEFGLIGRQGALCGCINYACGRFWASEHAVVVAPLGENETKWLGELLRYMDLGKYSQSAAQPGLAVDTIASLLVPVPSPPDQRLIAAYLDHEAEKTQALIDKIRESISKLREYRTALISAAITGKIDVRSFSPKEV